MDIEVLHIVFISGMLVVELYQHIMIHIGKGH